MDFVPLTSPTANRRQKLLSRLRLATPTAPKPPPSLPTPPPATDPNATTNPGFFPGPRRSTHSRLLLSAISRGPHQLTMYRGHEIVVGCAGKFFPLFLNGRGGKWKGGWRPAMGFPLLDSTSWAQEPFKRLFEEVLSILEGVYGHNLNGFRPRVVGFDDVDMEAASLDDFLSSQETSALVGRLVLGFTPEAKE